MQFRIDDMSCGACVRGIEQAVARVDAKARVEADLPSRTVWIETAAAQATIQSALQQAGFPAQRL
ncbi:heavy metal transport/detoxification protein [Lysobacteraceae bacterium NML08-0793]|nr:heavy metal transport/detoxification protein [Xanthomonadaceae bacterium NML08-0793]